MGLVEQKHLQQINLNRVRLNSIEFENQHVELIQPPGRDYAFSIGIINYGAPAQICLTASHEIGGDVEFLHNDFVVVGKVVVDVIAHIRTQRHGSISVTVGYGSNTRSFDIDLIAEPDREIDVDPSLAIPIKADSTRLTVRAHMPPAMKVIGALVLILVILRFSTDVVPTFIGATAAAFLLLIMVIVYFLYYYL